MPQLIYTFFMASCMQGLYLYHFLQCNQAMLGENRKGKSKRKGQMDFITGTPIR